MKTSVDDSLARDRRLLIQMWEWQVRLGSSAWQMVIQEGVGRFGKRENVICSVADGCFVCVRCCKQNPFEGD